MRFKSLRVRWSSGEFPPLYILSRHLPDWVDQQEVGWTSSMWPFLDFVDFEGLNPHSE